MAYDHTHYFKTYEHKGDQQSCLNNSQGKMDFHGNHLTRVSGQNTACVNTLQVEAIDN